jgi:hypothetical protein
MATKNKDKSEAALNGGRASTKNLSTKDVDKLAGDGGSKKSFLTYEEVSGEAGPQDVVADQMDDVMGVLGDEDIEIVDAATQVKIAPKRLVEEEAVDAKAKALQQREKEEDVDANYSKSNDPVRMYLRKMGSVSLLTREGEVEIAKRIEQGELMVLTAILNSPVAVREIIDLGDKLRKHKIRVKDIIRDAEEDDREFDEEEADRRVLRLIDKVKHLDKVQADLLEQLDSAGVNRRKALEAEIAANQAKSRGQPAPGHLHRQEVHQPRPLVPGPHPGGQHGPDEGRRKVRVPPRLQILHLRHLVDSPGHHPLDRRPGPHHPHPGAHDRDHQQAHAGAEATPPGLRPRAHPGGNRRRNANAGGPRPRRAQDGPAAHLPPKPGGRLRRHQLRRLHRGQVRGKPVGHDQLQPAQGQAQRRAQQPDRARAQGARIAVRAGGRLQPHARGGGQAVQGHPRAHPSDRGQGAAQDAPPSGAEDVLAASGTAPEGCDGSFVCRGGLVVRCADRTLVASCARGCAVASLDDAVTPLAAAFVLCARAGDAGAAPR